MSGTPRGNADARAPRGRVDIGLRASAGPPAMWHDVVLLDLDGVVYLGSEPVAGAPVAVERVRNAGARVAFVTNNASRTPEAVAARLRGLGVAASADDVVTSAQAAARLVAERFGGKAAPPRVLAVGGEGLRAALEGVGCVLVSSADDRPDAVAQGFAPTLSYADLAEAALAVRAGAWWIATNRDRTLPTERGIQPGNGALVGAVEVAVGRPPAVFAGKPDEALLTEALRRTGATRPLFVGDRLDTDVEGAGRVGIASMCVLTGVSSGADLVAAPRSCRPTYVGATVAALLEPHPEVTSVRPGQWRCGDWVARINGDLIDVVPGERVAGRPGSGDSPGGRLAEPGRDNAGGVSDDIAGRPAGVGGRGDPVDLLRAVCVAAWTTFDGAPPGGLRVGPDAEEAATAMRLDGLLAATRRTVG